MRKSLQKSFFLQRKVALLENKFYRKDLAIRQAKPLNSAVETRILDLCSNFQNHNTTDFLKKKVFPLNSITYIKTKLDYEEEPNVIVIVHI
jgi:hypothetical protein